jgi:hypothetical protein
LKRHLESRPKATARLVLEVSAGGGSPPFPACWKPKQYDGSRAHWTSGIAYWNPYCAWGRLALEEADSIRRRAASNFDVHEKLRLAERFVCDGDKIYKAMFAPPPPLAKVNEWNKRW